MPMGFCIKLYSYTPEKIYANIDGITRPAFPVGWGYIPNGFNHIHLKAGQLGIYSAFAAMPLPVYIQSHALQRLAERLDCLEKGFTHYFVYYSLLQAKIWKNKHDKLFIEYSFFDFKLGYLRVDIIEGKVIIRTFLFITNNGTPEGDKLNEFTGLNKLDHKYLNIDKLSTFISSDIRDNPEAKEIFIHAGCKSLFDLNPNLAYKAEDGKNPLPAMNLMKYLTPANSITNEEGNDIN